MPQCAVRFCDICEHSPGNQHCINCEQNFCNSCKVSHLKAKVSKMHTFVHVDKLKPEEKIPICKQHQETVAFFCFTCNCLLCQMCLTVKHKTHDFLLVSEAVSRKRTEGEVSIESAETNVLMLESKMEEFQDHNQTVVVDIESRRHEIIEIVNSVADDFITRVKQHETNAIQHMGQEIKKKRVAVHDMKIGVDGENDVIFLTTVTDKLKSLQISESYLDKLQYIKFIKSSAQIKEIETTIGSLVMGNARSIKSVEIGDRVKVKASVKSPVYTWGAVTHNSIGIVNRKDGSKIVIDFPEQKQWTANIEELEFA